MYSSLYISERMRWFDVPLVVDAVRELKLHVQGIVLERRVVTQQRQNLCTRSTWKL